MQLPSPAPQAAGKKSQRGLILSIAGIASGVIIALILALILVNREDAPQSLAAAEKEAAASGASRCGLPGLEKTATLTEVPDAPWVLVGTVGVPEVAGTGPGVIDPDGFRYCYAHTALGALVAAMNVVALGSADKYAAKLAKFSYAPKSAASSDNPSSPGAGEGVPDDQPSESDEDFANWTPDFQAFKLISYSQDKAVFELALDDPESSLRVNKEVIIAPIYLEWHEGDWRYQEEPMEPAEPYKANSLAGFTLWNHCRYTETEDRCY